ncbi:SWIM zinc finger domain-containing protein [Streptomyces sp. NPDC012751]|uniref:SWIM zinc finger family protein n=1 Tax=Streptomyces sp. NPDC012751 TaxID=3364846 RepID=UPI0036A3C636
MGIRPGFTEGDLRNAAGPVSFARGEDYAGAVSGLDIGGGTIRAAVPGRETYRVELAVTRQAGVTGSCDCPYGAEGHFCKHCVAVGLAALRRTAPSVPEPSADEVPAPPRAAERPARQDPVPPWLGSLDRDALLALLGEESAAVPALRERLLLRAEVARADRTAVRDRVKGLLDPRAFAEGGYADPDEAEAYARQAEEAVAVLRALVGAGRAAEAVDGARWALWRVGEVHRLADGAEELLPPVHDLVAVHLRACRAARPEPEPTARWLVGHLLGPVGEVTPADPVDYHDVLGPAGLTRALELATEAWRSDPADKAAVRLRERLLKARGDVDALVAAYAADLAPDGATHLRIARELDEAGRAGDALEWAERGLRAAGKLRDPDHRLVEWVCERYARAGRFADALAVRRDRFRSRASLESYRSLRSAARACGCWAAEREAALESLRADAGRGGQAPGLGPAARVLVDVLLDEGEVDAAWEAAAGHADDRRLLTLADRMRDHRPADALGVYLRLLEPLKRSTRDQAYHEIARLLRSVRACHERLGTAEEFSGRLAALRAELKRKPKLMRILDQNGL